MQRYCWVFTLFWGKDSQLLSDSQRSPWHTHTHTKDKYCPSQKHKKQKQMGYEATTHEKEVQFESKILK